jgi:hypothetical protein
MLAYHPESRESLAAGRSAEKAEGKALGTRPPVPIKTSVRIEKQGSGSRSALMLTTTDRPGLLVDVVRVLKDCSLNVVSASINTKARARACAHCARSVALVRCECGDADVCCAAALLCQGLAAEDTFYVTYRGKALDKNMARAMALCCALLRVCALAGALALTRACCVGLCAPQTELVTNALQYYLTMAELEKDESY